MNKISHLLIPVSWVPLGSRGLLATVSSLTAFWGGGGSGGCHWSFPARSLLLLLVSALYAPVQGPYPLCFFTWVPGRASLMVGRRGRLHFVLGYLTLGREVVSKSPSLCPAFADMVPCLIRKSVEGNSTSGGEGGEAWGGSPWFLWSLLLLLTFWPT